MPSDRSHLLYYVAVRGCICPAFQLSSSSENTESKSLPVFWAVNFIFVYDIINPLLKRSDFAAQTFPRFVAI